MTTHDGRGHELDTRLGRANEQIDRIREATDRSGNVVQLPGSVFDPIRTLTANIALELGYALDVHRSALFVTGLLLMIVVVILVFVGEAISRTRARA